MAGPPRKLPVEVFRKHWEPTVTPDVGVKALELLLLRRKITVGDVAGVLAEYRVGW